MARPNKKGSLDLRRSPDCEYSCCQAPRSTCIEPPLTTWTSEDGTIDHSNAANKAGGHKLGPKANQGAINAGLRALDRSGKPCRKWARGGFRLKTFTGVVWEINRWTAPNKNGHDAGSEDSAAPSADADADADSSSKENKENGPGDTSAVNSNNGGGDHEAQSSASVHASSPAPMAVAVATS